MGKVLKVIVAIPGVLFVLLGLRWLVDPAGMADELGMPLLLFAASRAGQHVSR